MKKYVFSFICLTLAAVVIAAENDEQFYGAFQNCSIYSEGGSTTTNGQTVKFRNQILGWQNDKCIYKENVTYGDMDVCVTCKFSKAQVEELVGVMRAYSTIQKYTNDTIDTSTIEAVKNNPVVNAWNNYIQNSNVCSINMSEK